jgi:hypothetical protein
MSPTIASDELYRMISGFQVAQAIMVAADLGLADHLHAGSRHGSALANATGSHPQSLGRLLRALTAMGVLRHDSDGGFTLTEVGEYLRSDVKGSHASIARLFGRPSMWAAWGDLLHAVKTGNPAFDHVHGCSVWDYRSNHPAEGACFDRAMGAGTKTFAAAVIAVCDFGQFRHVVDLGGGDGTFLAELLIAHPNLTGTLFDQPHVVAKSRLHAKDHNFDGRCRIVGGDFFEDVPGGADAYLLKWILHDWDDHAAREILRACRSRMAAGGRVIIVEHVIGLGSNELHAALMDLNMMAVTGGRVRSKDEFSDLLEGAGLRLVSATPTSTPLCIIEGASDL